MKYSVMDSVVMRTPVQAYENMNDISYDTNFYNYIFNNNMFIEALNLSNYNIYQMSLKEEQENNTKLKDSLARYFNRACTRPSPYGLYSGVTSCRFGKATNVLRNRNTTCIKDVKVDLDWYYSVIGILEQNLSLIANVNLKFNDHCYILGEHILNPNFVSLTKENQDNEKDNRGSCNIICTRPIKLIYDLSKQWISYSELTHKLKAEFENVPDSKVDTLILRLIDNGYLFTNLRSPLTYEDPLQYTIALLTTYELNEDAKLIFQQLQKIEYQRKLYNAIPIGEGTTELNELVRLMEELYKSKDYLNAITQIPLKENFIGENIKRELEAFMDFLVLFGTTDNESFTLQSLKKMFQEKYGVYVEVPVLELMDPTLGIGDPYKKKSFFDSAITTDKKKNINKYLQEKIEECIYLKKRTFEISQEDIQYINSLDNHKENKNIPYSNTFDLAFNIHANKLEDISEGNFQLAIAPCIGAQHSGGLVNRFYGVLEEYNREILKDLYQYNIDHSEWLLVDTSFIAKNGRINNIYAGNKNYCYSLDCCLPTSCEEINLSDLYIGFSSEYDRLYVKSKSNNKIVNIVSDSMLNRTVVNPIFRLLRDISYGYELHPLEQIMSLSIMDYKYMPTIKYGKMIILHERWRFTTLDFSDLEDFSMFKKDFELFTKKWNVPSCFYIFDSDKYLYINVDNEYSFQTLYIEVKRIFKKRNFIEMSEANLDINGWLRDIQGKKYMAELVVHCKKNEDVTPLADNFEKKPGWKTESKYNLNRSVSTYMTENRVYTPGDDGWFYFKLYINTKKHNDFLSSKLALLINDMTKFDQSISFFFIRYADPEDQIRVRIKTTHSNDKFEVIKIFNEWFLLIKNLGYSSSFTMNFYDREIERYGGYALIESAEEIFMADSKLAITMLSIFEGNDTSQDQKDLIYSCLVYDMITGFIPSLELAEECISLYIQQNDFRNEFRKIMKPLMNMLNNEEYILSEQAKSEIKARQIAIKNFKDSMDASDKLGELTNSKDNIIMSFVHMFCNRVCGDRYWERKISAYVSHIIHAINMKNKHFKRN